MKTLIKIAAWIYFFPFMIIWWLIKRHRASKTVKHNNIECNEYYEEEEQEEQTKKSSGFGKMLMGAAVAAVTHRNNQTIMSNTAQKSYTSHDGIKYKETEDIEKSDSMVRLRAKRAQDEVERCERALDSWIHHSNMRGVAEGACDGQIKMAKRKLIEAQNKVK